MTVIVQRANVKLKHAKGQTHRHTHIQTDPEKRLSVLHGIDQSHNTMVVGQPSTNTEYADSAD